MVHIKANCLDIKWLLHASPISRYTFGIASSTLVCDLQFKKLSSKICYETITYNVLIIYIIDISQYKHFISYHDMNFYITIVKYIKTIAHH